MTEYEQTKNGETLQEGYCEEDYQQVLASDPDYEDWLNDQNLYDMIDKINEPLKRPF